MNADMCAFSDGVFLVGGPMGIARIMEVPLGADDRGYPENSLYIFFEKAHFAVCNVVDRLGKSMAHSYLWKLDQAH